MIPKNSLGHKVFGYGFGYGFGYDFQKHNLLIFNKTLYFLSILFCFFNLKKILIKKKGNTQKHTQKLIFNLEIAFFHFLFFWPQNGLIFFLIYNSVQFYSRYGILLLAMIEGLWFWNAFKIICAFGNCVELQARRPEVIRNSPQLVP